jgi:hypothetical protein
MSFTIISSPAAERPFTKTSLIVMRAESMGAFVLLTNETAGQTVGSVDTSWIREMPQAAATGWVVWDWEGLGKHELL